MNDSNDTLWWERPYPGGPMVAVKGFPRPLYPPDIPRASGHDPSIDGSDIEAYKRAVSRAGRWPWQAFDQAYSNAFAHGRAGGNVGDSGVEGVQRQANIQPTGNIGKETFNLLRSIRIPESLPHAGEPAMDTRAVELVNAAWDRFGGEAVPPSPPQSAQAAAAARLERAASQVGYKENPASSNLNKYGDWYGMNGVPWCAIFCTWADLTGSSPHPKTFVKASRYSYVPYIVSDAKLGKNGLSETSSPIPGDLVCYDWARDGVFDHVGIVDDPSPSSASTSAFTAIEGNTSTSNNSNGGQVMRRTRDRTAQGTVFVRVAHAW